MYDKRYSRRMAVALVNGDKDGPAIGYERPDGDVLRSRASASEVRVFRFDGGHVLAPAETVTKAARWLHQRKQF